MQSKSKSRIGVIADTSLLRQVVSQAMTSQGYEVVSNSAPDAVDFELVKSDKLDVWLVELEDEDKWLDIIDQLLDQAVAPILFGDGQAPSQTNAQYPRWQRRIFDKLTEIIGQSSKQDKSPQESILIKKTVEVEALDVTIDEQLLDDDVDEEKFAEAPFDDSDIEEDELQDIEVDTDIGINESESNDDELELTDIELEAIEAEDESDTTGELVTLGESDKVEAIKVQKFTFGSQVSTTKNINSTKGINATRGQTPAQIWVLGASLGGPAAVKLFLDQLPDGLPIAFVLAQHIDSGFQDVLAQVLGRNNNFNVSVAKDNYMINRGDVIIAPVNGEIKFTREGQVKVTGASWDGPYSPSVDQVMTNVCEAFGKKSGAIIFSGMGDDSSVAGPKMKDKGCAIWAQSAESCANSSQPDSIRDTGCVSFNGTPQALAFKLVSSIRQSGMRLGTSVENRIEN